jgi:hypothetical protein
LIWLLGSDDIGFDVDVVAITSERISCWKEVKEKKSTVLGFVARDGLLLGGDDGYYFSLFLIFIGRVVTDG